MFNVKDKLKKEMKSYVENNRDHFLKEINEWSRRIVIVEYYLSKMDVAVKKFIEDLYINHELNFKQVIIDIGKELIKMAMSVKEIQ